MTFIKPWLGVEFPRRAYSIHKSTNLDERDYAS